MADVSELEIEEQVGASIAIDVADPQESTPVRSVSLERSNLLALAPVTNPECVILKYDVVAVLTYGIAESVEIKPRTLGGPSDPHAYVDYFASEIDAGHFVEAARRIIEHVLFASYTPIAKSLPDFNDVELRRYEKGTDRFNSRHLSGVVTVRFASKDRLVLKLSLARTW